MALVAAAPSPARAVGDRSPATEWPGSDLGSAERVVELVNEHRSKLGLAPLGVSGSLASSADWKARHMAHYGYMQHSDPAPPVARSVGQRLEACGYASGGWGENIAYGYPTPEAVVAGWLASSGHRANIENPSFTAIGVGAAAASGGTMYWAQNFGTLGGSSVPPPAPAPSPSPPPTPSPSPSEPPAGPAPTPVPSPGPSPPAEAPVEEPPPEAEPVELRPRSFAIRAGSLKAGGVTSLAADDAFRLAVRSRSRRTAWTATFGPVPGSIGMLRLTYMGSSSLRCDQAVALWSFARGSWVASIDGVPARGCVRSALRSRAPLRST